MRSQRGPRRWVSRCHHAWLARPLPLMGFLQQKESVSERQSSLFCKDAHFALGRTMKLFLKGSGKVPRCIHCPFPTNPLRDIPLYKCRWISGTVMSHDLSLERTWLSIDMEFYLLLGSVADHSIADPGLWHHTCALASDVCFQNQGSFAFLGHILAEHWPPSLLE